MIITQRQMQTLAEARVEQGNVQLLSYLKQRFPTIYNTLVDDSNQLNMIRTVRATARRYGITREDNVATFLDLTVMYGAGFHLANWAADILNCQDLHAPDKIAVLRHRVKHLGIEL